MFSTVGKQQNPQAAVRGCEGLLNIMVCSGCVGRSSIYETQHAYIAFLM